MLKLVSKAEDDFTLIDQFKKGNEAAFRVLINKHKEKVRNLIYLTLGDGSNVDDLAQEVFIKVYFNLGKFEQRAQFTTWLYRVTVNLCKDQLRKRNFNSSFDFFAESTQQVDYNTLAEDRNIQEIVHQAISQLPAKLRIPLILRDIEGFNYKEIAEITKCELGTVKSRLSRARETLRNILEPVKKELML